MAYEWSKLNWAKTGCADTGMYRHWLLPLGASEASGSASGSSRFTSLSSWTYSQSDRHRNTSFSIKFTLFSAHQLHCGHREQQAVVIRHRETSISINLNYSHYLAVSSSFQYHHPFCSKVAFQVPAVVTFVVRMTVAHIY